MSARAMLGFALLVHLAVVSQGQKAPPPPAGAAAAPGPTGPTGPTGPLCRATFASGGVITSPNYPNNYADYTDCTYILTAASGGYIQLTFNDFDLEANYDNLTISSNGLLIGRYTGTARPPVLTLGSSVTLRFTSDYSIVKRGFSVTFATILANCGGLVVGSGVIRSPGYPVAYTGNLQCVWGVVATQGKTLTLDFQAFNTESYYDWLELYEGSTLVARYSGSSLPPKANLGPAGRVIFTSDSTIHNQGFNIAVASVVLTCGGLISGSAAITSPNFPNNYSANASCTWTYRALSSAVATRLAFSAFDLENNYDYVKIYEGEVLRTSNTGSVVPKTIELRSRTITVIFTTDRSVQLSGFRLYFTPIVIA